MSYDPVETIPLSLHREKDRLLVTWSGHVVVEVEDQTGPSVLDTDGIHAELFLSMSGILPCAFGSSGLTPTLSAGSLWENPSSA
ncbi:MAG: hypothetical protein M5U34_18465 [Chloroflexi bacterium]|nr:hypothetical protein [Chloroflexota bacterium]